MIIFPNTKAQLPSAASSLLPFAVFFKEIVESNHYIFHLQKLSSFYFRQSLNINWPHFKHFPEQNMKAGGGEVGRRAGGPGGRE